MTTVLEMKKAPALEDYFGLSDAELNERIEAARKELGSRLVILGHHYQRDDVICHADYTGDSLKLAQLRQTGSERERIARQRSGLIHRAVRRKLVHDVGAPAERPNR